MTDQLDAADDGRMGSPTTSTAQTVPSHVWRSAYAIAGAMLITIPLGIGFFLYEGIFALLSDAGGLLVGLLLAPLVWGMRRLYAGARRNGGVFALGVGAVAGICVGSVGLIAMYLLSVDPGAIGTASLGVQFLGWILFGVWLLGVGVLGRRTGRVEPRTSWAAMAGGVGTAGGMLTLVYSYAVGSFTIAFPLFMALFVAGFVLWAVWLGGELRARSRDHSRPGLPDTPGSGR